MIELERPLALLLALPWLAFALSFGRAQSRALGWIEAHVHSRFRPAITRYSRPGLRFHLAILTTGGLLLVAAAAAPVLPGRGRTATERGKILFLIDASSSMTAGDASALSPGSQAPQSRLELARQLAENLVDALPDWSFGVVSFSGQIAIHLPQTTDRALVREALRTLEIHAFYRSTGSSFARALDEAVAAADPDRPDLQVVLLSDGEMPREEEFSGPLAALAELEIPVHSLALGSEEGVSRVIWDFRDVVAGKEDKRVLREYHTRRVDEHLAAMAEATGGSFAPVSWEALGHLVEALRSRQKRGVPTRSPEARRELAPLLLGAFLLLFVLDGLVLGHRPLLTRPTFDLTRLGGGTARALLVALLPAVLLGDGACGNDVLIAHHENEAGIAADAAALHPAARRRYERSAAFGIDPQVPLHNQGRSHALSRDWAAAHRTFQRALEIDPTLAPGHYNDGIALHRWGVAERDPRGCRLERTAELWRQSLGRFETAAELAPQDSALARDARSNREALAEALRELEALAADPPPECAGQSAAGGAGGGEGERPAGEGPPGEQPSSPPPPSGSKTAMDFGPGELDQVAAELERIAAQRLEPGKFHRRTRPEQFGPEAWQEPDDELWW